MRILGCDPGLSGGLAVYDFVAGKAGTWAVSTIPTTGDEAQRRIDVIALRDWLRKLQPQRAYFESVWSLPREASSFAFRYGRAIGALESTIVALDIPMVMVVPTVWKRHFGLLTPRGTERTVSEIKGASLTAARAKFPSMAGALARQKNHGIAEAMLIAFYGAQQCAGDLLMRLDDGSYLGHDKPHARYTKHARRRQKPSEPDQTNQSGGDLLALREGGGFGR